MLIFYSSREKSKNKNTNITKADLAQRHQSETFFFLLLRTSNFENEIDFLKKRKIRR